MDDDDVGDRWLLLPGTKTAPGRFARPGSGAGITDDEIFRGDLPCIRF